MVAQLRCVPGPLNMTSFDRCLTRTRGNRAPVINLERATFVDSYALVGIACVAAAATFEDRPPTVVPPRAQGPANYLARMDLGTILERLEINSTLPTVQHGPVGEDVLCELRAFRAGDNLEEVVDLLWNRLKGTVPADVFTGIIESLWELGDNTLVHADTPGGLIAVQVYSRNTQRARVNLAIGDVGIGIAESLRNSGRYDPPDDLEAIDLALQPHVSSIADAARGVGLPTVAESVRGVAGKMLVRTGAGCRVLYPRRGPMGLETAPLQGTLVGVSIPCR